MQTRLADAALPVLGDPGQVEQAVINLAVNARDAMPGGGTADARHRAGARRRGVRAQPPADARPATTSCCACRTRGTACRRETQAHIFEPFFTTKDVGKGTGLGLSMVYGTLKQIGGFIFVDSEVNRGTTFRLYFPPAAAAGSGGASGSRPRPTRAPRSARRC